MEIDEYRRMAVAEDRHWWYEATRSLLGQLLADDLRPGARVLDAGCGTGATGAWTADRGARLVAVDLEPEALRIYRERHPAAALGAVDLTRLPFADGSFDVVLCVTVLYHRWLADPAVAVAELARVLRPGGVLCLQEPGVRRLRRAHDRVTQAGRRFSVGDLAELVSGAGLDVERRTGAFSFLVPPAAVKALVERRSSASDLDRDRAGLGGLLPAAARLERRWLARRSLPVGLSALALGRKPPGPAPAAGAPG